MFAPEYIKRINMFHPSSIMRKSKILAAEAYDGHSPRKKFAEHQQTTPYQLLLFEMLGETDILTQKSALADYSRTIELYDFMPKYVWAGQEDLRIRHAGFLPMLEREFECRSKRYKLVIHPSGIIDEKSGEHKYFYPGIREEIVEDVLRKMLIEKGGLFLDDNLGMTFSIHQIREELREIKHSMSYYDVKKALHILKKTTYELISADKKVKFMFSPLTALGLSGTEDETETFVVFSPLVTESIKNLTYRLYNYRQVMTYKSVIARQLHKRMAHHYTQASISTKYTIGLTTIIRDFGLTPQSSLGKNLSKVQKALDEMTTSKANVILDYALDKVCDVRNRNKLVEVIIQIIPTPGFVSEVMRANHFEKKVKTIETESSLSFSN